jgi:hypothetical protein
MIRRSPESNGSFLRVSEGIARTIARGNASSLRTSANQILRDDPPQTEVIGLRF